MTFIMKKNLINSEILVEIFFFIISFCKGIGLNNSSKLYLYIYLASLFLAAFKLFSAKYNKRELLALLIILLVGLADYILGGETTILFTAISLMLIKDSSVKKIIKVMLIARIFSFAIMILFPLLKIIPMHSVYFYRLDTGTFIERYSFGYEQPNLAHFGLNIIFILIIYLYYDKIKLSHLLIFEIINLFFYQYTFSRTGFIILTIYLILVFLMKKNKKILNLIPKILSILFFCFIIISFLMAILYKKFDIFYKIDQILTGRIRYMNIIFTNYSIPIFKSQNYYNVLFDNGYFDLIYNGGIIAFLWFSFFQHKTNKIIKENLLYKEALLTFIFLLYSVTESYYVSSLMNVSLLFLQMAIYSRKKEYLYYKSNSLETKGEL